MKRVRFTYYFLLVACLLIGLYTGSRVFHFLFLFGLFLAIGMFFLNLFTLYSFRFTQELTRSKCTKDERSSLELDLRNETVLPLSMMNIHVEVASPSEKVDLILNLSPFSGKKFDIPLRLPYRGVYRVGMTRILINDIFGIVPSRFDMRKLAYYRMKEVVVLPRVLPIDSIQIEQRDAKIFGTSNLRNEMNPENYSDARQYRPGDPNKRILWKKSFQQRRLYIRQYDVPARETVFVLLDTAAHGLTGDDLAKYADAVCEYAATLCMATVLSGKAARFGFSGFPDESFTCDSVGLVDLFREMLAHLVFDGPAHTEDLRQRLYTDADTLQDIVLVTRNASASVLVFLQDDFFTGKNITLIVIGGEYRVSKVDMRYVRDGEEIIGLFKSRES
ncbi:MAG: DUF58 domain-containing protein [Clostridiales bacterium]|nr:DUF58 domain-containing protein [Clostridiales bacterium]